MDLLYEAAVNEDRLKFGAAPTEYLKSNPKAGKSLPYILSQTLGKYLGSGNLAWFWGMMQNLRPEGHELAARVGFTPGSGLGEEIFQAILKHPGYLRNLRYVCSS